MSRRVADGSGLKGVTTFRNGQSFAVSIPKFSAPANAHLLNVSKEDVYEKFRKLTPKQRIAVLTIRDRNLLMKLYTISNNLWYKKVSEMRATVGSSREDDEWAVRQFLGNFEFLFGDDLDDDEDDSVEGASLTSGNKQNTNGVNFSTNHRPMNSTFTYTKDVPTSYRPKLHFISTKDVLGILLDNSKDFLGSRNRWRCRVLQHPDMWDKLIDQKESTSYTEFESILYQLLEFRIVFEYFNGFGKEEGLNEPFACVKRMFPTDEEKWAMKEKQLLQMEEAHVGGDALMEVHAEGSKLQPSKSKRKKKKSAQPSLVLGVQESVDVKDQAELPSTCRNSPNVEMESNSENDTDDNTNADDIVMNHVSSKTRVLKAIATAPLVVDKPFREHATQKIKSHNDLVAYENDLQDSSDWVQVGSGSLSKRKGSMDSVVSKVSEVKENEHTSMVTDASPPALLANNKRFSRSLTGLSKAHLGVEFKVWRPAGEDSEFSTSHTQYICEPLSVKTELLNTFIHVGLIKPPSTNGLFLKECPF